MTVQLIRRAGAVAIAVGSLIALLIAETCTLFGFSEDGFETPIATAIAPR